MGQDVIAQGNHNLDISSIEALANDVSKRFRANVSYGYYDQYWWDIYGIDIDPSYEHIEFGYIPFANAKETIVLSDELYQVKQLLNKYGNDILKLPCFNGSKAQKPEIEAAKKGATNDKEYKKNRL